jgi:trehalose-phosphatase
LDYDGTLADFAPTPDHVFPEAELVELLSRFADQPQIRVAVISGRRLAHVQKLVPVPGILLAGTYGVELQTAEGVRFARVAHDTIRPTLDALKPRWESLIAGHGGFYLEDKGWALALHARFADEEESERMLAAARRLAAAQAQGGAQDQFRLLGGHKFLEIGPALAHKGRTVDYLLDQDPWPGCLPLYLGDDDKDEEAFVVVRDRGGLALLIASEPRATQADARLDSPQAARRWLRALIRESELG